MAVKRGRPTSHERCNKMKAQEATDSRIIHCQRRAWHKPPCSNGKWKWTDRAVLERP